MSSRESRHPEFLGLQLGREQVGQGARLARNIEFNPAKTVRKRDGLRRVNHHRYNGPVLGVADVQRICDYNRLLVFSFDVDEYPDDSSPSADGDGDFFDPHYAPSCVITVQNVIFPDVICTAEVYDPQGSPLTYHWDFGDGTTSNEKEPVHAFPTGVFTIFLTVVNMYGKAGTDVVSNEAPTAVAGVTPSTQDMALPFAFSPAGSFDPEGDTLLCEWDFGDGSAHSWEANPTHIYTSPGPFIAALTVRDGFGASDTDTVAVYPQGWEEDLNTNTFGIPAGNLIRDFCIHNGLLYFIARRATDSWDWLVRRNGPNSYTWLAQVIAAGWDTQNSQGPRLISFGGTLWVARVQTSGGSICMQICQWTGAVLLQVANMNIQHLAAGSSFVVIGASLYCFGRTNDNKVALATYAGGAWTGQKLAGMTNLTYFGREQLDSVAWAMQAASPNMGYLSPGAPPTYTAKNPVDWGVGVFVRGSRLQVVNSGNTVLRGLAGTAGAWAVDYTLVAPWSKMDVMGEKGGVVLGTTLYMWASKTAVWPLTGYQCVKWDGATFVATGQSYDEANLPAGQARCYILMSDGNNVFRYDSTARRIYRGL